MYMSPSRIIPYLPHDDPVPSRRRRHEWTPECARMRRAVSGAPEAVCLRALRSFSRSLLCFRFFSFFFFDFFSFFSCGARHGAGAQCPRAGHAGEVRAWWRGRAFFRFSFSRFCRFRRSRESSLSLLLLELDELADIAVCHEKVFFHVGCAATRRSRAPRFGSATRLGPAGGSGRQDHQWMRS